MKMMMQCKYACAYMQAGMISYEELEMRQYFDVTIQNELYKEATKGGLVGVCGTLKLKVIQIIL